MLWQQNKVSPFDEVIPFAEIAWLIDPNEIHYEGQFLRKVYSLQHPLIEQRLEELLVDIAKPSASTLMNVFSACYAARRWDMASAVARRYFNHKRRA